MACVYTYVIILTILGPEYKGRFLDAKHDHDLQEATGLRDANAHSGSDDERMDKIEQKV
jgi:SHS family lactate transporter-like MFS transporter